jgi:MSHA biogenesis protein MshJ
MAAVLEDMLTRNRQVRLVSLKTLPVSGLLEAREGGAAQNVYKHGIELTLQGAYLDLLDYLTRLEKLPVQMFWAQAKMDASEYPRVRLTVIVYTLSLDKNWLVV